MNSELVFFVFFLGGIMFCLASFVHSVSKILFYRCNVSFVFDVVRLVIFEDLFFLPVMCV